MPKKLPKRIRYSEEAYVTITALERLRIASRVLNAATVSDCILAEERTQVFSILHKWETRLEYAIGLYSKEELQEVEEKT